MFASINSMGLFGLHSFMVSVESDLSGGLPRFDIVGLPDAAVSEAKNRVRHALTNSGFDFPQSRITVNLAPADIRKEGPVYDLAILIALILTTRQASFNVDNCAFLGELSLDGSIRKINGVLPMVIEAYRAGISDVFIPAGNAFEASVVKGINVYPVEKVSDVIEHLNGSAKLSPATPEQYAPDVATPVFNHDFADVKGQEQAKRALEVAAAGGHNIMMIGPPGSGKSMLAKRLGSILPEMTFEESLDTTKIYSVAGALPSGVSLMTQRPFRSPHHSISSAGLSGGGAIPRPGEISLAHNGVLFLDELPEFSRTSMEVMRQPIEDGEINIARVSGTVSYPSSIMLVCAMNPCPCGYFSHPTKPCTCANGAPAKYLAKVSGPLLDRLDIHIEVPHVDFEKLSDTTKSETSAQIKQRVDTARRIQQKRLEGTSITCNAKLSAPLTREFCTPTPAALNVLKKSFDTLGLSARAYDKILRVARTIADLDDSEKIDVVHIAEAVQYRSLDRKFWK